MSEPIYEVPIIHQDLRQEETIFQIVDSLEYLQKCAHQIFDKIDAKLEESDRKLNAIQQRTANSRKNIQKLTGIKKATKVISSAKYPGSEDYCPYKSIFSSDTKVPFTTSSIPIKSKIQILSDRNIQEKMQFYHVKNTNKMLRKNFEITTDEGLGPLPKNIKSVSSLLLFNTTENPYKRNLADCFGLHYKIKHAVVEPQETKTKPVAMKSIPIEPETQIGFYTPGEVEVPELDIPMDLPNLPGIADDLDFSFYESLPVSAPIPKSEPKPAPVKTAEPPPPPPPTIKSPEPTPAPSVPVSLPAAPPSSAAPPPPPPPPPPVGPTFVEATSTTSVERKPAPRPEAGDMRANLMEAIRQAGGSGSMKLRSVSEKKMESKKKKQEEKEKVVSGDLMADLHAKLMLRRTGISGRNQASGGGGLLEKVAAMIPPPPGIPQTQQCDSEEGSDWEP